jgi:hypothetical protein
MSDSLYKTSADFLRIGLDTSVLITLLSKKNKPADQVEELMTILKSWVKKRPTKGRRVFGASAISIMELTHLAKDRAKLHEDLSIITESEDFDIIPFNSSSAFGITGYLSGLHKDATRAKFLSDVAKDYNLGRKHSVEWVIRDQMILASVADWKCDIFLTYDVGQCARSIDNGLFSVFPDQRHWHISSDSAELSAESKPPLRVIQADLRPIYGDRNG